VNKAYDAIKESKELQKDLRLVSQIQGAAVSVMANMPKAFRGEATRNLFSFLFISKSSAAEVQSTFTWRWIKDT